MRQICCIGAIVIATALAGNALALSFAFTYIDDTSGTFATRGWLDPASLFQRNIRAAADLWGAHFDSNATIVVHVDTHSYAARAGGTNTYGRYLYTNTAGNNVWEVGPLTRILTGSNPGETFFGYDILLGFDATYVENQYWFDPQPELRTAPVPANKNDFMSVALHELGHGFGMTGNRDFPSGQIIGSTASQIDDRSYFGGNGNPIAANGFRNPMFFRGDHGSDLYGGDLHLANNPPSDPLYSQNYYHLSNCNGDGLQDTLMSGCYLPEGARLEITPFDTAVYADLGYPLVTPSGDYDGSGKVDAADYVAWRKVLGQTGVGLAADGNLNNQIDAGDYDVWRSHFGQTSGSGMGAARSDSAFTSAVPEPASALLLVLGAVAVIRQGSRRLPSTRDM